MHEGNGNDCLEDQCCEELGLERAVLGGVAGYRLDVGQRAVALPAKVEDCEDGRALEYLHSFEVYGIVTMMTEAPVSVQMTLESKRNFPDDV